MTIPIVDRPPRRCFHCGSAALLAEPEPVPPAGLDLRTRGWRIFCLLCAREVYLPVRRQARRRRRAA